MKLLLLMLFSILLLSSNVLKIDKLVVKSIHIDSAKGFSFKNMIITFEKRKDAKLIIKGTFNNPKYIFSDCASVNKELGCMNIKDSSSHLNQQKGK